MMAQETQIFDIDNTEVWEGLSPPEPTWKLLFRRPNDEPETYVVELSSNGWPYHVIPADPLYEEVSAEASRMGADLGEEVIPTPPPPGEDDYRRAIQALIDSEAQKRRYDSGATCASYVNSTVEAWAIEARAFVDWRDRVWAHAYAELANVEAGNRQQPTVDEFLTELPLMEWPE